MGVNITTKSKEEEKKIKMTKLEIPIHIYMGEFEEIINELKQLQTYKLFDDDDKVLINCDDTVKIFINHLHTEILNDSVIELERKQWKWTPVSEKPIPKGLVFVTYNDGDVDLLSQPTSYRQGDIVAWMPLPEPWKGEKE